MCMAVPMKIVEINGDEARCEARGEERIVNIFLVRDDHPAINDHVLVHAGCAKSMVSAEDAKLTWDIIDQALAIEDSQRSRL